MSRPRALENIRVVDFSWVRAGPWATRGRLAATSGVILETFPPGFLMSPRLDTRIKSSPKTIGGEQ